MPIKHSVYTSTVLRSDLIRYMKWKHLWGEASKHLNITKSCNVFFSTWQKLQLLHIFHVQLELGDHLAKYTSSLFSFIFGDA